MVSSLKGIVLHGGAGTRLRPLTFSGPKQLIPVANKPVSQYVIEDLRDSGIRDIGIVIGSTFPDLVRDFYKEGSWLGVKITYIYQGRPLGIAHAVSLCKDFVGSDDFVVYLGDNLLQEGISGFLNEFVGGDYDAYILLKEVDDPRRFGVAELDASGKLIDLVEKPEVPPSNFALVGVYFFKPVVFEVIKGLKPSWRGELEITDALRLMLKGGYRVGYSFVKGWWLDTGKKDDILYANAVILDERAERKIKGEIINSRVEGRVMLEEGSKVINSVVRGPAVIGSGALIKESFIGPYTSIGRGAEVTNSSVEYSVVLDEAVIKDVERLEESLIGRRAKVMRNSERRVIRLNVGDYSTIEI